MEGLIVENVEIAWIWSCATYDRGPNLNCGPPQLHLDILYISHLGLKRTYSPTANTRRCLMRAGKTGIERCLRLDKIIGTNSSMTVRMPCGDFDEG